MWTNIALLAVYILFPGFITWLPNLMTR